MRAGQGQAGGCGPLSPVRLCSGTSPHPGHEPPSTGIYEREHPPFSLRTLRTNPQNDALANQANNFLLHQVPAMPGSGVMPTTGCSLVSWALLGSDGLH